ncbi:MAG: F0F1 ATP synthase subunit alpha, partial [Gemmatimonadota bacterium]|nr:F0F1 ATP synthase subunit alpha [Gemmatimonadota bacterium]
MKKIQSEEISSILLNEIKNYQGELDVEEVGNVLEIGDGIARIYGLQNCM